VPIALVRRLLHLFRRDGQMVKLGSSVLEEHGVSREAKRQGLRKLESVKLIKVKWYGNKAPEVTWLIDPR
jgi:hypothetical protein